MTMETKHTRGPWRLSDESPQIVMNSGNVLIGRAAGHPNSGFYPTDEEAIANALLFAAAPELYEALAGTLDWLASYPGFGSEQAWLKAHAALAKARGEA